MPTLDAHRPLVLSKLAALLALLDDRRRVNIEDWTLAKIMWETSCAVRDVLLAKEAAQRAAVAREREDQAVALHVRSTGEAATAGAKAHRVARMIAIKVHEGGGLSRGAAYRLLASRDRSVSIKPPRWPPPRTGS